MRSFLLSILVFTSASVGFAAEDLTQRDFFTAGVVNEYLGGQKTDQEVVSYLLTQPKYFDHDVQVIRAVVQGERSKMTPEQENKIYRLEDSVTIAVNTHNAQIRRNGSNMRVGGFIIGAGLGAISGVAKAVSDQDKMGGVIIKFFIGAVGGAVSGAVTATVYNWVGGDSKFKNNPIADGK